MLLHHLSISVSDLARAREFYDPLLQILGYEPGIDYTQVLAWKGQEPEILVYGGKADGPRHELFNPGWHHSAFKVSSRAKVEEVYALLQRRGDKVLDPPCECPEYAEGYYATFFEDPDGLKWEVAYIPVEP